MENRVAKVAVDNAAIRFDRLYDYRVPDELLCKVKAGSRVMVMFGNAKTPRMGIVAELCEGDGEGLKSILSSEETPLLEGELFEIVKYLKYKTCCGYFSAVKAVLPVKSRLVPEKEENGFVMSRSDESGYETVYEAVGDGEQKLTEKQAAVLSLVKGGELTAAQLCERAGVTRGVIDALEKKGVIEKRRKLRTLNIYSEFDSREGFELSQEQKKVAEALGAYIDKREFFDALLFGVTGSGKTVVYVELIERALKQGRSAMLLVPEISLTPQTVYRLKERFGQRVAVCHSGLSDSERLVEWERMKRGEAVVAVGTRSAVFSPIDDIGLIIIDEEQEQTYRSEKEPRYLAHDVARFRAKRHGAVLLLASATPSVKNFYFYEKKGRIFELKNRYADARLPEVETVDMREELASGNMTVSAALAGALEETLKRKEQAILLLNRRGYRTLAQCTKCGRVKECVSCSIPMVYHKPSESFVCHYCGHREKADSKCPDCGAEMRLTGVGTQRVEEKISEMFPDARVLRMDLDAVGRKNAHEKMFGEFAQGKYDILVGTQMVAKGLDFQNVTLVGVLGIDQLLYCESYRAYERVFSLVTQVVGRSGRGAKAGRAVVQTIDPNNAVLALAAQQNYRAFYESEIELRRAHLYPPFCSLCVVGFSHASEEGARRAAKLFAELLKKRAQKEFPDVPVRLLGPTPFYVAMVRDRYRCKLIIKCRDDRRFREMLDRTVEDFTAEKSTRECTFYIDFNSDGDD